jgi:hypothetical protein
MCGTTGFMDLPRHSQVAEFAETAPRMAGMASSHGPDVNGVRTGQASSIAIGHFPLSILSLSSVGAQPMLSQCSRIQVPRAKQQI